MRAATVALVLLALLACSSCSSARPRRMHRETWGILARPQQVGWFCWFRANVENHMDAPRYEGGTIGDGARVTAACEPLGLLRCALDCTTGGPGAPDPSTGYPGFACRTADLGCQPYVRADSWQARSEQDRWQAQRE